VRVVATIAAGYAGLAGSAVPAGAQRGPSVWQLQVARTVLEAAFPELIGGDVQVVLTIRSAFNYDWLFIKDLTLRITQDARRPAGLSSGDRSDEEFLQGHFLFDNEHLEYAGFSGRRVRSGDMEILTNQVKEHPDWTELQLAEMLRRAGVKYGPDARDAFANSLRLDGLVPALGKIRSRALPKFTWRLGRSDLGADDITTPTWLVNVDTSDTNNKRRCYGLLFEPIAGDLRGILDGKCG
jgi:hypothetical protein